MSMLRGRSKLAIGGLALSLAAWIAYHHGGSPRPSARRLPAAMTIEEPVARLSATFEREAVIAENVGDPVHMGRLQPGHRLQVHGGPRAALVAPPPSVVRFSAPAPDGAVLRFAIGVAGEQKSDADARGIRFTVRVDGDEVLSRTVNPAATRHDRRWFDARVELPGHRGGTVEVELQTEAIGSGTRLAGTPGWSHVRIVRETERSRQLAGPGQPNVLLLLVDTLRADHLGCYGARPSPSPNLDRVAQGGLLFEQVVAQSAWTMPSVASIFTGVHPRSHGVVGVAADGKEGPSRGAADGGDPSYLPDALRTLAQVVQAGGITTVGVSSNPLVGRSTNLAKGFESFVEFGWEGGKTAWPRAAEINGVFLDWLAENREYRFLGYLHYMDIHAPYQPPRRFRPAPPPGVRKAVVRGEVGRVAELLDASQGERALDDVELTHLRNLYDGGIAYWDAQLALLLDGLRNAGVARNTIVIVTADHGEEFLEHGRLKHGVHLYDELVRVPLVVSGPVGRAGRIGAQVQGIDLFPSIARLLGLTPPAGLPGHDVLAAESSTPAVSETSWGLDAGGAATELVSIRTPAWKLIHQPETGRFELYDLVRDPAEQDNRFGKAEAGEELVEQLSAWKQHAPAPPEAPGHDPEFRDKLRALGYIEE